MKKAFIYWILQSISGLVLTGTGLSICIDAGLQKLQQLPWFWEGTLGLIIFQSGLCILIDSLVAKMKAKGMLR